MKHPHHAYNQNRQPVMAVPPPPSARRHRGRYPLRFLEEGQEFTTLLTRRLGYILQKETSANRCVCILEPADREVSLHCDVIVEAH